MKARKEFDRAGVYVLVGPSDTSGIPQAYVGEGDPVRMRLEDHHSKKDFWTIAFFFTSKDSNLNKAHIEFLEHRLIAIAKEAKRCRLDNGNTPSAPSLSEAESADVEAFLEEMLLCFPVLGVSIFERPEPKPAVRQAFLLRNKGINAEGYESEDGFVVRQGSTAVVDEVPSIPSYVIALRKDLLASGILVKRTDGLLELSQDYEFSSPSAAAAVLLAASINGRDWWKTPSGKTLKQLQEKSEDS